MSNDWKKDLSLIMRNAIWNWSTEKYKAYVTLINDLYNYKIFKVGEWPIKPLEVGDEKTLPLAKKAVFKYIEDHSTGESMSKAREFLEGTMKKGIWIVLSGAGGELDREFVNNKSEIKGVLSRWASIVDVGDTIKIESGEREDSGS